MLASRIRYLNTLEARSPQQSKGLIITNLVICLHVISWINSACCLVVEPHPPQCSCIEMLSTYGCRWWEQHVITQDKRRAEQHVLSVKAGRGSRIRTNTARTSYIRMKGLTCQTAQMPHTIVLSLQILNLRGFWKREKNQIFTFLNLWPANIWHFLNWINEVINK